MKKCFSNIWNEGFVKNTFKLDGKNSYGFYQPESSFLLPGMKHLLKNTFRLYGNRASSSKKIGNSFCQHQNIFLSKSILHNFDHGFNSRKIAPNKSILFPLDRKQISTSLNERFIEKYICLLDVKVTFSGSNV